MRQEKRIDSKLCIVLLQAAAVIIILITFFIIKQFNLNLFTELKDWYMYNFEKKTNIDQVLDDEGEKNESGTIVLPEKESEFNQQNEVTITNTVNLEQVKKVKKLNVKSKNSFTLPVEGTVTSSFGGRPDPFSGDASTHKGLDIAADYGKAIVSVCDGVVSEVGYDEYGYGSYIIIKHAEGFETMYAHCSKILSKKGQKVKAGEAIAKIGNTGRSTGSHLHFEIKVKGIPIDPKLFLGDL